MQRFTCFFWVCICESSKFSCQHFFMRSFHFLLIPKAPSPVSGWNSRPFGPRLKIGLPFNLSSRWKWLVPCTSHSDTRHITCVKFNHKSSWLGVRKDWWCLVSKFSHSLHTIFKLSKTKEDNFASLLFTNGCTLYIWMGCEGPGNVDIWHTGDENGLANGDPKGSDTEQAWTTHLDVSKFWNTNLDTDSVTLLWHPKHPGHHETYLFGTLWTTLMLTYLENTKYHNYEIHRQTESCQIWYN